MFLLLSSLSFLLSYIATFPTIPSQHAAPLNPSCPLCYSFSIPSSLRVVKALLPVVSLGQFTRFVCVIQAYLVPWLKPCTVLVRARQKSLNSVSAQPPHNQSWFPCLIQGFIYSLYSKLFHRLTFTPLGCLLFSVGLAFLVVIGLLRIQKHLLQSARWLLSLRAGHFKNMHACIRGATFMCVILTIYSMTW